MRRTSVGIVVLGLLTAAADRGKATILLFDQERDAATQTIVGPTSIGGILPSDYGDHVTSAAMAVSGGFFTYGDGGEGFTPDIGVEILSAGGTGTDPRVRLWQNGYGDQVNVIFADGPGTAGAPLLSVRLTAAPGYQVDLYGFNLAGFGADYAIAGAAVLADSATLFLESNVLVHGDQLGPLHTNFEFTPPLSSRELLVQVDLSNLPAGIQDNVGMDSIRFGQTPRPIVPEPSSCLMASAIALTCFWKRRRETAKSAVRRLVWRGPRPAVAA